MKLSIFTSGGDGEGALFDLRTDPEKRRNLFNNLRYSKTVARMVRLIAQWDRRKQKA